MVTLHLALYQRRALLVLVVLCVLAYLPIQVQYGPRFSRVLERAGGRGSVAENALSAHVIAAEQGDS